VFGWEVRAVTATTSRCCATRFKHFATVTDKPKVFIADTIKGKGVSFMQGVACGDQTYHFHAGAPTLENYVKATRELIARVNDGSTHSASRRSRSNPRRCRAHRAEEAGKDRARLRR
jgi:transketolase